LAGVLIEMRAAILRRSVSNHGTSGSRGRVIGGLALMLFVTVLAVGTLLAGLTHLSLPGRGRRRGRDAQLRLAARLGHRPAADRRRRRAALIALGAQSGAAAALAGSVAVLLELVLAVVASTVAIAVFGPTVSSTPTGYMNRSCRRHRSAR
jgi:hypothetical protein